MLSTPHIISVFILTMFVLQTRKQKFKSQPWETVKSPLLQNHEDQSLEHTTQV